MSCWIIPIQRGSGYFPEPLGSSIPCMSTLCSTYARAPFSPVSSLFHSANRMERCDSTSDAARTRAISITNAVPEPSSFAASPPPRPSMCAPMMYISSGREAPIFVAKTSSRGSGTAEIRGVYMYLTLSVS